MASPLTVPALFRIITSSFVFILAAGPAAAQPAISSVMTPGPASTTGGDPVLISGAGFSGANPPMVMIGGVLSAVESFDNSLITALTPAGQGVALDVTVSVDGQSSTAPGAFSYDAPLIASLDPASGPLSGQPVTISGANFGLSPQVTFGGVAAPLLSVSHTSLEALAPAGAPGTAPVVVTVGGQSSPAANYTYTADPLSVTSITPNTAPTAGGVVATITGTGFAPGTTVSIGGFNAQVVMTSPEELIVVAPEGQGAGLNVVVNFAGRQSTLPGAFSYQPPTVSGLSEVNENNELMIFGDNFGITPQVIVGGVAAIVIQNTHSMIVASLPQGAPGASAPLLVNVAGQVSAPVNFTYPSSPADLNNDGVVDGADLAILLANWGLVQ